MAKQRRRTLALEQLEDRWVPATIHYDGSNLTITNLTGAGTSNAPGIGPGPVLAVTQQANGSFQVKVNGAVTQTIVPGNAGGPIFVDTTTGANNGAYFVTGNLNINAGGGNVTIQLTLDNTSAAIGSLPGNLSITTGNGNDTVILTTTKTSTGGTIGGNVSLNFGSGADFFEEEPPLGVATSKLFIGGNVSISGLTGPGTLAAVDAKGMENFAAHNWAEFNQISTITKAQTVTTTIGGSINVRGITEANIDAFNEPTVPAMVVGGNVTVQESSAPSPAFANPDATGVLAPQPLYNNYVVLSVSTRIGGSVSISGTAGSNFIMADSNIGGSLSANFAASNGNNTLDLNLNVPTATPGFPMTIGKDVNFTSGNGNNTLLFDDSDNTAPNGPNPLLIGGSVNVNFGNGNNNYETTNNAIPGADVFISGNLSIRAGNGVNVVATGGPFAVPAATIGAQIPLLVSVAGNESFILGNGGTVATPNIVDLGTAQGGSVYFSGGNGVNKFTLENSPVNGGAAQFYNNFTALFGNGANTFTLGTGADANLVFASGSAIGGTGTNSFVQFADASPISVPFFLKNF